MYSWPNSQVNSKGRKKEDAGRKKKKTALKGGSAGTGEPAAKSIKKELVTVGGNLSTTELFSTQSVNPKISLFYQNNHDILLVGEGDFSFTLALSIAIVGSLFQSYARTTADCACFRLQGGNRTVATSYDTRTQVFSKYGTAENILSSLQRTNVKVCANHRCQSLLGPHLRWSSLSGCSRGGHQKTLDQLCVFDAASQTIPQDRLQLPPRWWLLGRRRQAESDASVPVLQDRRAVFPPSSARSRSCDVA